MTETNSSTLEQQIAELQKQLDIARVKSGQDSSSPYERQEVHTAVGEQIRQRLPTYQTQPSSPIPAGSGAGMAYQDPALAQQVQMLVNTAFTQSIQIAIDQAVKSGNPALIDALHDVMVDQLHDELIKRQKLQPAV